MKKFKKWLGNNYNYIPQADDSLGRRMLECFRKVFSLNYEKVIVIGSDSPDLEFEILNKGFDSLDDHEAVIGPAVDGGYYLIGFNKGNILKDIFNNIKWSTDTVFSDTMRIFRKNKYKVCKLPFRQDIDTIDDLKKYYNNNSNGPFSKSETLLFIKGHLEKLLIFNNNRCFSRYILLMQLWL